MVNANTLQTEKALDVANSLEPIIDEALQKSCLTYSNPSRIGIVINGEYSKLARDMISERYVKEGGFSKVTHHTSSENGERAGLTSFTFYF